MIRQLTSSRRGVYSVRMDERFFEMNSMLTMILGIGLEGSHSIKQL